MEKQSKFNPFPVNNDSVQHSIPANFEQVGLATTSYIADLRSFSRTDATAVMQILPKRFHLKLPRLVTVAWNAPHPNFIESMSFQRLPPRVTTSNVTGA